MSELYYSVDVTWYDLKKKESFLVEGWMFAPDAKTIKTAVFDQDGKELSSRISWKERPDVVAARQDIGVFGPVGFQLEILDMPKWIQELKYLEIQVFCEETKKVIARLENREIRKTMLDSTIIYEVDVKQLLETQLVVQGWFVDMLGIDRISVMDEKQKKISCEIYRTVREDARVKYADYIEKNHEVGFTIRIPRDAIHTSRVRVCFENKIGQRSYWIDVKEMQRESTKAGRLYNALRPGKFSENMEYIREHNLGNFVDHVRRTVSQEYSNYNLWVKNHRPDKNEVQKQRKYKFGYNPKISIVIPLYNTPVKYLKQIVDSIVTQTYENWELCLADGSPDQTVEKYIRSHYRNEKRVLYRHLSENKGISENTNAAVALATGDYIMLSDHDDIVEQGALFEIVKAINENPKIDILYTDEDKISMDGKIYFEPNFKPDFNPFFLESNNYICHIFVVRTSIMKQIGGFRREFDGAQDYDLILRCWEATSADRICHIPKVLYHWRCHPNSTAANPESKRYAYEAGAKALDEHFARRGIKAHAEITHNLGIYRIHREVLGHPKVSIIIPNKDHAEDLETCLASVTEKTTYDNYEILVVENNSADPNTFAYYEEMTKRYPKTRLLIWEREFNYAAINNFAVQEASGEYLLFLNNVVELITENWLEQMLGICQQPEVGMVGVKLYYPDETIQHAGVIIGLGGVAGHIFSGVSRYEPSYVGRAIMPQNLSAVTAACMMMKRSVFEQVKGFDEKFQVAFNDVDLCMKTTQEGYQIVFTPDVELYHYESKSRGVEDTGNKQSRFYQEVYRFESKWPDILKKGDPYYNVNLSLEDGNCNLRDYMS